MEDKIIEFLKQSNYIEGEYSEDALEDAKRAWDYLMTQNKLTLHVISKAHYILMQRRPLEEKYKGYFRDCPVYIGRREALNWKMIPTSMINWIEDVETSIKIPGKDGKHIKIDHITYEKIHPFVDGNGRTGRMFMNWERLKAGLDIEIIWESEKYEYYKWFQ